MIALLQFILSFVISFWWLWLPVVLFLVFRELWLDYRRWLFFEAIPWMLLEVRIPREILKTPKAMELAFTGIGGIQRARFRFWQKWWDGKVQEWVSCEVVGIGGGGIAFFIRTPVDVRSVVESKIYAQYPAAEIFEVEDYTRLVPADIPNRDYDVAGAEMILEKDDAYPIRTYLFFEETIEERRLDPLANLTELMSHLKPGEQIWVQVVARPVSSNAWKEKGDRLVDELIGRKRKKKESAWGLGGIAEALWYWLKNFTFAPFEYPTWPEGGAVEKKDEGPPTMMMHLSPGEKDVVEAIQANIAKPGFEVGIRWLYIARKDAWDLSAIPGMFGVFKQFSTQNLNGFKSHSGYRSWVTRVRWLFRARREYVRKRRLLRRYRWRWFPEDPFIFNAEELATVYHYPIVAVEAPMLQRLEARKGEPPVSLPTL